MKNPEINRRAVGGQNLESSLRVALAQWVGLLGEQIDEASAEAMDRLKSITYHTAPRDSGTYRRYIRSRWEEPISGNATGNRTYIWYVEKPYFRLTHLLEDGHKVYTHGRKSRYTTQATHFLSNAVKDVTDEYVSNLESIIERASR